MKISKRFVDRARPALRRYQKILAAAKKRDVGESDTVVIVTDFLADVLGYDKYAEITTEFAIRSTFCDLAIKTGNQLRYLIEVKAIGTDLKENHLRQAVDYGAKQGADWVLLTNGACWRAYRIIFEQPVRHEDVFSLDLLDDSCRPGALLELLWLISRESASGGEIEQYWRRKEATSRFVIARLLQSDALVGALRRELRHVSPGLRVDPDELRELLRTDVLKRDALEGEKADSADKLVKKAARRLERSKQSDDQEPVPADAPLKPVLATEE